jgi:hypothetical protein
MVSRCDENRETAFAGHGGNHLSLSCRRDWLIADFNAIPSAGVSATTSLNVSVKVSTAPQPLPNGKSRDSSAGSPHDSPVGLKLASGSSY